MKKAMLFILLLFVLAGCMNTPKPVNIQATIDAAVSTALAPYEEKISNFVTSEDLEQSQTQQNILIQQYIDEHIERAKDSFKTSSDDDPEAEMSDSTSDELPVTIIYKDGVRTTATPSYYSLSGSYKPTPRTGNRKKAHVLHLFHR